MCAAFSACADPLARELRVLAQVEYAHARRAIEKIPQHIGLTCTKENNMQRKNLLEVLISENDRYCSYTCT